LGLREKQIIADVRKRVVQAGVTVFEDTRDDRITRVMAERVEMG